MSAITEAEMDPRLTFFIRGPPSSGKSTLLNAMFAQGINAVWADNSPLTINVTKDKPEKVDSRPSVLDFSFGALGGLFPLVDALKYRFVSTSGEEQASGGDTLCDAKIGVASALCAQYTKHASAVLLVLDKEKLECVKSQQPVLVQTVKDLKAAQMHAQADVPLIVIINKVDDADDSDVVEKADKFRDFLIAHLQAEGMWSQPVEVVLMSALHSFLYRSFLSASSFDLMTSKDVVRLCGMELGGQGKDMAKDPKNYQALEKEVSGRLQTPEAQQRWQAHCGLASFVTAVTKVVLTEKSCFPLLQRRLSLQLDLLPLSTLPPPPPPPPSPSPSRSAQLASENRLKVLEQEQLKHPQDLSPSCFSPAKTSSSFSSMLSMGFTNNPLFSSGSVIRKNSTPQKLLSPSRAAARATSGSSGESTTSATNVTHIKDAVVTDTSTTTITTTTISAANKQSQNPDTLMDNMSFIIGLHTQYARLVPNQDKVQEGRGLEMDLEKEDEKRGDKKKCGDIDNVPSHPLFSADIAAVRKKFRTDIQHACTVQYRKNFAAYLKSMPSRDEKGELSIVTKDMALHCLHMIDAHAKTDEGGMRSVESWNNARTKSIVMLLELLWSHRVDQGFFCHTLSSPPCTSTSRNKIKRQVLVTMQILSAAVQFAASHYGMTDRLVVQLFIPFIETLPNAIATMSLPSFGYRSSSNKQDGNSSTGDDCMETTDNMHDDHANNERAGEAEEKQFMHDARRNVHSSSSSSTSTENLNDSAYLVGETNSKAVEIDSDGDGNESDRRPAIVLVHIERCVLTLILGREEGGEGGGEESSEAALKLIRSLVSRKIDVRDKIMGYTTCLREMLWSFSDITQKSIYNSLHKRYFTLFFPVIHCPLPQMDEMWGQALSSNLDYDKEIAQFPCLESERELVLRAMLQLSAEEEAAAEASRANRTPSCTPLTGTSTRAMPPRGGSGVHGGRRMLLPSYSSGGGESVHSGLSDMSGTGVSSDDQQIISQQRKRGNSVQEGQQQGDEEESRSKRKRGGEERPAPSSESTPGKGRPARSTPSRMRIIRKFGEC